MSKEIRVPGESGTSADSTRMLRIKGNQESPGEKNNTFTKQKKLCMIEAKR